MRQGLAPRSGEEQRERDHEQGGDQQQPQALLLEAIGRETETDRGEGEEHGGILLSSRNRKVINQDLTPTCSLGFPSAVRLGL